MEGRTSKVHRGWRKSTHSGEGSSTCVEVAELSRGLAVRDSTDPAGPRLAFPVVEWQSFLGCVKALPTS